MTEIQEIKSLDEAPVVAMTSMQQYVFANSASFETAQRMAKCLASSSMVPKQYQGKVPNCVVALEVSQRTNSSVLMVMQNLAIIHGKPSWSSQYIIAALNTSGRFQGSLEFKITKEGEKKIEYKLFEKDWNTGKSKVIDKKATINNVTCVAFTKSKTGQLLESPEISIEMAYREGWVDKSGSKWKTMPELMLRYRAASFFGRLYAPEVLMGMQTAEEVIDVAEMEDVTPVNQEDSPSEKIPTHLDKQEEEQEEQKKGNEGLKNALKKRKTEPASTTPSPEVNGIELDLGGGKKVKYPNEFSLIDLMELLQTYVQESQEVFINANRASLSQIMATLNDKPEAVKNLKKYLGEKS